MKKFIPLSLVFFVFTAFTLVAITWKNDPAHSQLAFTVKHFGINNITGYIKDFDVTIDAKEADLSDAVVTLTARTASIDTRIEARDKHLKSPDFFNVDQYPEITFKSTSIERDGKNEYKLKGNLTMHGVTRPVELEMEYKGTAQNPNTQKQLIAVVIEGKIKRSDFNVGAKFPEAVISDEVEIKGQGEFIQK